MDLQFLFNHKIQEIQALSPGYDDHASDVWLVNTENEEVVVRSSRMIDEPNTDFWWGCKRLFGIDPRNVHQLEHVNNVLSEISTIPIPRVIKKGANPRQFVVVEKLEGQVVHSLINQPTSVLQSLGEGLARIHSYKADYIGSPAGEVKISLVDFHQHVSDRMREIVSRFYTNQNEIKEKLPEMVNIIKALPTPDYSTFVLVDIDPTQFLTDGKMITGLVDTEAYVMGPRELDFIGLEYILDEQSAVEFKLGYEKVMSLPDLKACRVPYRYLYRLLSVQGSVDLEEWLNYKEIF